MLKDKNKFIVANAFSVSQTANKQKQGCVFGTKISGSGSNIKKLRLRLQNDLVSLKMKSIVLFVQLY